MIGAVLEQIHADVRTEHERWLEVLSSNPGRLGKVEEEVHGTFAKLADHVVAVLLAESSQQPQMNVTKKKSYLRQLNPFARRKDAL